MGLGSHWISTVQLSPKCFLTFIDVAERTGHRRILVVATQTGRTGEISEGPQSSTLRTWH